MYKVARVVIGENKTFVGGEEYLKKRGVEVVVLENQECIDLMTRFIEQKPHVWYVSLISCLVIAEINVTGCLSFDIRMELTAF